MKFSWVLPVHNDEATLPANVARLAERTRAYPGSDIVLVENGSRDRSWEVCVELGGDRDGVAVRPFREPAAGIGYAYARGIEETERAHPAAPDRWVVLTGSDLPWGFTDLENALPVIEAGEATVIVGSKAHPRSQAFAGWKRYTMSFAFRLLRRAIVGMKTGDSQGSFFVRSDVAYALARRIRSRDFFYTTELVYFAEPMPGGVVEVPATLEPSQLVGVTTVRPWKHGSAMLRQLVALRQRGR